MIFNKSFKGGVHPHENKDFSKNKPIEKMSVPNKVIIPIQQHTGAPCKPLVNVGDEVKAGQKIAEADGFISSPVHATINGKVTAIDLFPHPVITKSVKAIVIENNNEASLENKFNTKNDWKKLSKEELLNKIKDAGIVGLGGAAFPTHVKLSPPSKKKIDAVIINGAECEPYLTTDHRVMLENTDEILEGIKIVSHILNIDKVYIGIEANKKDAIEKFKNLINEKNISNISVVTLKVKYPQGSEKQLIKAIVNREVPRGGLPFDVNVIVQNVGTIKAIYDAIVLEKPLIERVVTVSGDGITDPKNLLVRIGTPISSVIQHCGGINSNIYKVIMGGPMMGIAQYSLDVPVIKGTSGILVFKNIKEDESTSCIRCGRCVDVCPMKLTPNQIAEFVQKEMFANCKEYGVLDCMECGACGYACSAKLPLVHYVKYAKLKLLAKK